MRKLLVVCSALALLAAGLGFAFFGGRAQPSGVPARASAAAPVAEPEHDATIAAPAPRTEIPRPPRAPRKPSAPASGIEEGGATPVAPPGVDFGAKYAGLELDQLEEKLAQLDQYLETERRRLFDARFAAGRALVLSGDDSLSLDERVRKLAPGDEADSAQLVYELRADPKASAKRLVLFLPRAEYPALFARMLEREWLAAHIAAREAEEP